MENFHKKNKEVKELGATKYQLHKNILGRQSIQMRNLKKHSLQHRVSKSFLRDTLVYTWLFAYLLTDDRLQ